MIEGITGLGLGLWGAAETVINTADTIYKGYKLLSVLVKGDRNKQLLEGLSEDMVGVRADLRRLDQRLLYGANLEGLALAGRRPPPVRLGPERARELLAPLAGLDDAPALVSAPLLVPPGALRITDRIDLDLYRLIRPRPGPDDLAVLMTDSDGRPCVGFQSRALLTEAGVQLLDRWVPNGKPESGGLTPAELYRAFGEPVPERFAPRPDRSKQATPTRPRTGPRPPSDFPPSLQPGPTLLDMVTIAGGDFFMGSPPATADEIKGYVAEWAEARGEKPEKVEKKVKNWRKREEPAHRIRLSPFEIARVPLTRGQWRAVMSDAPSRWKTDGSDNDLPATNLDWTRALTCCNALSEHEGLMPCYRKDAEDLWHWNRAADGYRLPTEAEWEYACRGGTETRWFWGDDPRGADQHAWYRGNAGKRLHPVGKKAPNPWKLHDMVGLVGERCWDRYGPYRQDANEVRVDPEGPRDGDRRVVRGGSFGYPPFGLRSANRVVIRPDDRLEFLGLRCVRSRARQP